MRPVFGFGLLAACTLASANPAAVTEKEYFCVVDQVVGLQKQKSESGVIGKGITERFRMKYVPPIILVNGVDPLYTSPELKANITGSKEPTKYRLKNMSGAFTSGALTKLSQSGLSVLTENLTELREQLSSEIKAAQGEPPLGVYVGFSSEFGSELLQFIKTGKILQGMVVETALLAKKDPEGGRPIVGYLYYFTCDDF